MAAFTPTAEQVDALDKFRVGGTLVIQAGAGTGKTSTVRLLAEENPNLRFQYLCFNKALSEDAAKVMPSNVQCQPDGTMVRVPRLRRPGLGGNAVDYDEVPIETLRDGDKVVSWNQKHGPLLRKRGRPIRVFQREYDGRLITASVGERVSRYTPEHPCLVTMDDAWLGHHVVYLMRRGQHHKVGMASWRLSVPVRAGGRPRNGLWARTRQEGADALWILGVYADRDEAAEVEALAQYQWNIPGWMFSEDPRLRHGSLNLRADSLRPRRTKIGTYRLWEKIPPNHAQASACLESFGRSMDLPFWIRGESMLFEKSIRVMAACNLIAGMKMLDAENSEPRGQIIRHASPKRVWTPITLGQEWYSGRVTSLEVADDHTYIADWVLTHNCNTAHSVAYRAVGRQFKHRLNSGRMRSDQIARQLGVGGLDFTVAGNRRSLAAGFLGSLTMKALERFCQSDDPEPTERHFPYVDGIDMPVMVGTDAHRTYENNNELRHALLPALRRAWDDWNSPNGQLVYKHSGYLKSFERSGPRINADVLLVDEAQDVAPVLLSIILQQTDAQKVLVGDAQQELYSWAGAVDAMAKIPADHVAWLRQSFRFGDRIAEEANRVLDMIPGAEMRLSGTPSIDSTVGVIDRPACVLTRTNAVAVRRVLRVLDAGERPHLVGGGKDVVSFAKAADELMQGGRTNHPELACFDSWESVRSYVAMDPQGDELRLMVRLVEDYGADTIERALGAQATEANATVILSTGHKSKGRQWATVALADDFRAPKDGAAPDPAELRLLYVSVTRAQFGLDITACPLLTEQMPLEPVAEVIQADALVDGTIQPVVERPHACPRCGRQDVYRERTGLVGAHRCEPAANADAR